MQQQQFIEKNITNLLSRDLIFFITITIFISIV